MAIQGESVSRNVTIEWDSSASLKLQICRKVNGEKHTNKLCKSIIQVKRKELQRSFTPSQANLNSVKKKKLLIDFWSFCKNNFVLNDFIIIMKGLPRIPMNTKA